MQNPETLDKEKISDQDYAFQQFGHPLLTHQVLKINHIFDQNGNPHPQYEMIMPVTDQMTFQQIKLLFYEYQGAQSDENFSCQTQKFVYQLDFTIEDETMTIKQFKTKINQTRLFGQFLMRLYEETHPFFIKLQSSLDYGKFQQKYNGKAQITLKFQDPQKYIYLDIPFSQTLGFLKKQLKKQLQNQGIKIQNKSEVVFKKQLTNENNKKFQTFTQAQNEVKVRALVKPGQIIFVSSKGAELIKEKKCPFKKDLILNIEIYTGYYNSQKPKKENNYMNEKKDHIIIKIPYFKVRSMKPLTLLKEFGVPNFQEISLISQNYNVLKPIDKFESLQSLNENFKDSVLNLQGITQNFLFYRQVRNFSKIKSVSPKVLLDLMMQQHKKISKSHRKQFQRRVQQRLNNIKEQPFKQPNFLHPIVLYTSPLIYSQFNLFSRETSPSHFDFETMAQKFRWQYPFSQKLIKSLQRIPNYRGIVYRGMVGVKLQHKQGEIIEFNSFTSTSINQKIARGFLNHGHFKVLMKIQTFSGKQIKKFSYYEKQDEVLLFPYNKFKVLRSQIKNGIHQIDLLELPMPKKIPGDIVVWVDANMNENYQCFNKYCYKNGIKNLQIIQLKSNEHLQMWIQQYRSILNIPNVRIHYITNLNRTKERLGQGVQTLRMIRELSKKAEVVFYIGDIKRTLELLNNKGYGKDEFINVISHPKDLNDIICSWKRDLQ